MKLDFPIAEETHAPAAIQTNSGLLVNMDNPEQIIAMVETSIPPPISSVLALVTWELYGESLGKGGKGRRGAERCGEVWERTEWAGGGERVGEGEIYRFEWTTRVGGIERPRGGEDRLDDRRLVNRE